MRASSASSAARCFAARRVEEFEFEQIAQPVDPRPEGGGRILAVGIAQLEQRQLDHRAVEEMMRDDVAIIARHRMLGGVDRIDGLAAGLEPREQAALDERVERRRESRGVAAFELAAEADAALACPGGDARDRRDHLCLGHAARRGAEQDEAHDRSDGKRGDAVRLDRDSEGDTLQRAPVVGGRGLRNDDGIADVETDAPRRFLEALHIADEPGEAFGFLGPPGLFGGIFLDIADQVENW